MRSRTTFQGRAEAAPEPIEPKAWRALAVSALGYVLFGFNSTATNLAFDFIAETFDKTKEDPIVSWVTASYFIASAAFLPLGGRLADRLGRKRVFSAGLALVSLSALLSAFAPTIEVLIAARAVQAVGGAMVIPASLSMILPLFPVSRRSTAVASWSAAGPLAAALAPSIASIMLGFTTWRWVYAITAPLALASLLLAWFLIDETRGDDATDRLDWGGTLLAIASISLLIYGISNGSSWGWGSTLTYASIVGSVLLGALFVVRSIRHPVPLLNMGLFRIPAVAYANAANFFLSITSLSIWLLWPTWLRQVWEYEELQLGLAITVGPIVAGTSTILGGRLVEKIGFPIPMVMGTAISTCAVLWSVVMFELEPNYWLRFFPTIAGFGLGWGISQPTMNSWALSKVPPEYFGETNATFNAVRNIAAAIGNAAVIAILGSATRPDVLASYARANLFFAFWVALASVTVLIGAFTQRQRSA